MLAEALLWSGRPGDALDQVAEGFAALEPGRSYFYEPELHRLQATALVAARRGGSDDEARSTLRRGLELADALGSPLVRLRLLLAYLDLGLADGDNDNVHRDIRQTLTSFPEDDHAPDLRRARAI
jgi:hypothetical protein